MATVTRCRSHRATCGPESKERPAAQTPSTELVGTSWKKKGVLSCSTFFPTKNLTSVSLREENLSRPIPVALAQLGGPHTSCAARPLRPAGRSDGSAKSEVSKVQFEGSVVPLAFLASPRHFGRYPFGVLERFTSISGIKVKGPGGWLWSVYIYIERERDPCSKCVWKVQGFSQVSTHYKGSG